VAVPPGRDRRYMVFSIPQLAAHIMGVKNQATTQKAPLERIFGASGWLARHHPRFEHRPGQLEMA